MRRAPVVAPPVVAASPAVAPPAVAPPVESPPVEKKVHLSVRGSDGAHVILDGADAGRVPLELDLRSRDGTRQLRVELAGHQPLVRALAAAESATVDATLVKRHGKRAPEPQKAQPEIKDPF
jgi:hypothetical protein